MNKTATFILSTYSFVFKNSINKLLDVGYLSKNGDPIPSFDENVLLNLCHDAKEIFEKENNILQIDGDVMIVGDIHGSFHDLIRILNYFQNNQKKVLFLGDYVDRGNFSIECITILLALKVIRPDLFFMIRGNHEFDLICSKYGFKEEILNYYNPKKSTLLEDDTPPKSILLMNLENEQSNELYHEYLADHNDMNCYKYSETLYDAFLNVFSYLPVCAIVNDTTFCIHGGLSPRLDLVEDLNKNITRPIVQFDENSLFSDVVWGDPSSGFNCMYRGNPRGQGYLFNQASVNFFLAKNSLKRIVRAHECVRDGIQCVFDNKCITVFSASSYSHNSGNRSGIMELFQKDDHFEFKSFPPIERLQKSDTIYYKVQNQDKIDRLPFSLLYPFLNVNSSIRLSPSMKLGTKPARKSHNSITNTKLAPFMKPSFTTKSKKSINLTHSPSIGNIEINSVNHRDKTHPKMVTSRSVPKFF